MIKLLGGVIISSSNKVQHLAEDYIDGLLTRLRDKGVSVRKTVVHILKEILLNDPINSRYGSKKY
jgi:hypothetical protein